MKDINGMRNFFKMMIIGALLIICGCAPNDTQEGALFYLLDHNQTGLDFKNELKTTTTFNVFNYMYFFNGGGVAAADFNQDGWSDLYFTSNMGRNGLFLNNGDLTFEEVTEKAGVEGLDGWTTGVTTVDINQDGLMDIYVSQLGAYQEMIGYNQLYVNQGVQDGVPVFKEMAAAYGLDLVGFSTQATFFDYDLDGDLDLFQLNHSLHQNGTFGKRPSFEDLHPTSGDKLLRNDGHEFTNVTKQAGINSTVIGYGLGVATGDINNDGWPDLYIGNDFHENDYLYLNQQDGTFAEVATQQMAHTSRFSMGVELTDFNNDGGTDIVTLDMLPEDPYILKTSLGEDGYNIFQFKLGYGYQPQFARNHLQLNNQQGHFSEIGRFAGIEATDWSWAPLSFDFDHDGWRDLFISNGIPRRMNDIDYINFKTAQNLEIKAVNKAIEQEDLSIIEQMPQIKLPNKFFRNNGNLTFEDIDLLIANQRPSYSNGACYVDLDRDGDLDIVVNNIDDSPFIYENKATDLYPTHHYLHVKLEGKPGNRQAIGAKLLVYKGEEQLVTENYPVRGYQSAVDYGLHLGIGPDLSAIDSILLIWPDGTYERLQNDVVDHPVVLRWAAGLPDYPYSNMSDTDVLAQFSLHEAPELLPGEVLHKENPFVEFNRETLIPQMVSAEGPALAVGDINGDQLEDIFLGGSKRNRARIFTQTSSGKFTEWDAEAIWQDSTYEDIDAQLVDLDNDNDLDLVVASGGNEYRLNSPFNEPRAYFNNGKGKFKRVALFEGYSLTASCVVAADFNNDGWVDLYFGARAVPWAYGKVPTSFLFENQQDGTFMERAEDYHESLPMLGMINTAIGHDIDSDQDMDLVVAMDWGPILWLKNENGHFNPIQMTDQTGWWRTITPADIDQDGDTDIIVGNIGKNNRLRPTKEAPLEMYVSDFDDNQQSEQVLLYHVNDQRTLFANYKELTTQLEVLKKDYLYAKDLAEAPLTEIFGQQKLEEALYYQANTFEHGWLEQKEDHSFVWHELPDPAQVSSLNAVLPLMINDNQSFILAGNFFHANIEMGWYTGNYGQLMQQNNNQLQVNHLNGTHWKEAIRHLKKIIINGQNGIVAASNNGPLRLYLVDHAPES